MKTAALLAALILLAPQVAMADNDESHFCFIDNEQVPCLDEVKAPTPVADVGEPDESTPTK
jgi:hypothetical protein